MTVSKFRKLATWLSLCAILLSFTPSTYAGKKKKGAAQEDENSWRGKARPKEIDHSKIDTSKLVWPKPPDRPRIRYVAEILGELKPPAPVTPEGKPQKKKQGWMDRLAGLQTTDNGAVKKEEVHVFARPYGIGVDSKGRVYVADTYVGAVFVLNLEDKSTKLLRNGVEARFLSIIGLTVDDADRIFVVDAKDHRVAALNKDWKLEAYFGESELDHPGGIAIDEENRFIYVVDTGKENVAVFDADSFKYLRAIGGPAKQVGDDTPGTFAKPSNVAVDQDGLVYVSDTMNNRVQVFDGDGTFVRMWGKHCDGAGCFARPKGISIDTDGNVWVVDGFLNNVQIFDKEGKMLGVIGGGGTLPGQFTNPTGIFVDKFNRVLVTDQFTPRLQVFRYITNEEAKAAKPAEKSKAAEPKAQAQVQPENGPGRK